MRDLDAQVAEKVMQGRKLGAGKPGHGVEIPHYSTSISEAWLVVEEMRKREFVVNIENGRLPDWWLCGFYPIEFPEQRTKGEAKANTAPEAICRAALEAVK